MPYVESPLDRIVGVQWQTGPPPPGVNIAWQAVAAPNDGTPLFDAGVTEMTVSTSGLPLLSPATLSVPTGETGGGLGADLSQEVFGEFPDGTGRVQGEYFLEQRFGQTILQGSVFYVTNAPKPYGGALSVAISLNIILRPLFRATGYDWQATAFCGDASATISGTATPVGGTISMTATMIIKPPSVSIG